MYKALFIYILLLVMGRSLNLPFFGKEIQIADIFFVFVLAGWLIRDIKRNAGINLFKFSPAIKYLFIICLILLLIACGFSINKAKSFLEFAAILYLFILYLWVSGIEMDQRRLKAILHFWLSLTVLLCILSLGGFISYTFFGINNGLVQIYPEMKSLIPFARLTATFPTMNMFASFLHVGFVFLLAVIAHERRSLGYVTVIIIMLICGFLTASRNLLGIFITIFLAILPLRGRTASLFKYLTFGLTLLLIFWVTVTTIWCVFPARTDYDRRNHGLSLSINTAPSLYAILNRMSIRLIKVEFLTGVGPGMFNEMMVKRLDWEEAKDTYEAKGFDKGNVSIDPHNTYLGWAAEAGLPFVLAVLGLLCGIALFIRRGYKICRDSLAGRLCYSCVCGLAGFLVNGLYIDILTMRHFWIMLGLGTLASGCHVFRKELVKFESLDEGIIL